MNRQDINTLALGAMLAASVLLTGAASAGDDDELEFRAKLTGRQEVPPVNTDTSGRANVEFNEDLTKAEFQLRVNDGVRVTQSHIHCAPKGVNGPIVVFLAGFHNLGWDIDGQWIRNATVTDANIIPPAATSTCPNVIQSLADLADAGLDGNLYVNVHTVANPSGEVRGQLKPDDDNDD